MVVIQHHHYYHCYITRLYFGCCHFLQARCSASLPHRPNSQQRRTHAPAVPSSPPTPAAAGPGRAPSRRRPPPALGAGSSSSTSRLGQRPLLRAQGLGRVHQRGHRGLRRLLHHAVAQVQHVPVAGAAGAGHAVPHRAPDVRLGAQQHHGVDVPGDGRVGPEGPPGLGHVHGPVHAQHVRLHVLLQLEVRGAAVGKVDHRHVWVLGLDGLHRLLGVRLGEVLEEEGAELVRPGLEDLDDLRAVLDLVAGVVPHVLRQLAKVCVEELRLFHHHLLDHHAVL
mmetsp:Transcript_24094/g.33271  ORF Transcript_24094/g.33271 Transcript_24094/m.33271 type:complete len:280 (+) Transcript_24094:270-1109(+)